MCEAKAAWETSCDGKEKFRRGLEQGLKRSLVGLASPGHTANLSGERCDLENYHGFRRRRIWKTPRGIIGAALFFLRVHCQICPAQFHCDRRLVSDRRLLVIESGRVLTRAMLVRVDASGRRVVELLADGSPT